MQVENLDRLEEHANNPETTIEELADQVKTISINVRGALGEGLEAHGNMLARSVKHPPGQTLICQKFLRHSHHQETRGGGKGIFRLDNRNK